MDATSHVENRELRPFEEILLVDKLVHIDGITANDSVTFDYQHGRVINRRMKPFFGNNKSYKFYKSDAYPEKYTHTMNGYCYHELWFKSKFDFEVYYPDLFEM